MLRIAMTLRPIECKDMMPEYVFGIEAARGRFVWRSITHDDAEERRIMDAREFFTHVYYDTCPRCHDDREEWPFSGGLIDLTVTRAESEAITGLKGPLAMVALRKLVQDHEE